MKTEIKKREDGDVEINVTMPNAEFMKYWDKGFKVVQEKVEIDGFRKGNAPKDVIVSKYGEMAVLEEMANIVINETYIKSITDNKINVIDHPHIHVVKLSAADDFVYMAHVPVYPEVTLPDYKKIAKEVKSNLAKDTKKEEDNKDAVDKVDIKNGNGNKSEVSGKSDDIKDEKKSMEAEIDKVLTELAAGRGEGTVVDDAFAQSFGENFPTLESLRAKVRENLELEKVSVAREKHRAAILEALLLSVECKMPKIIIESEIDRMMGQMEHDVINMGNKWADYLTHAGKTEESLRKEYEEIAAKRALSQVLLAEIAKKESLIPNADEIDVEVIRIMTMTPDAKEENVKGHVTQMIMNEKVLKMLES